MWKTLRRRQDAQAFAFAAVAMVALVGALAIVIDTGIFFVVQRQLQTAADAGALAGAWHDPICASPPGCLGPPLSAAPVALAVAHANADTVKQLCGGIVTVDPPTLGTTLVRPSNVNVIVVTVECDAGYSFGRILNLTTKHVTASAAAAIGDRQATVAGGCVDGGDMTDFTSTPPCGRMARLVD